MTTRYTPVNEEELVETRTTKLVSKVAGDTLNSAGILTRYAGLGALGICLFVFSFVADVPANWMAIMAGLGAALAVTGFVGFAVFRVAFITLNGSNDEITVTRERDPKTIGIIEKPMVQTGPNRIVVGPTSWTTEQWKLVAKAVKKKHGAFSRGIIEKSGARVSNLNAEYARLAPWLKDNRLITDTTPGARNPKYVMTNAGARWLYEYDDAGE